MKKCLSLISLLCVVALLLSAAPLAAVSAAKSDPTETSLLDQIIARDGLLDGVWYPWLNSGQGGHNLTGNDVMAKYYSADWARVELDYYGADNVYREIYNLKAMGYNMMAWGGSIYGEGVIYDEYGDVLGIKQDYLDNARRLLDMCREIGMPVMWNIYFHSSSLPGYYGMQGWNVISRMLGDRTVADHYAQRFVRPLCEMLAEYPDVVALISIADEPENEVNDAEIGNHFDTSRGYYGVNMDDMVYFLRQINDTVREVLPSTPRTVASNGMNKSVYRGFELDLMGHNRYDNNANVPTVEDFITDADILLTEYNVGGDGNWTDAELANQLIRFRQRMMEKGYKGGFQWCWIPNATGAAYYMLNQRPTSQTDFKETVTLLRHYMDDYRAERQGKTIALDAAVLYANDGTGLVEWIPSRQATKMTLERSDDGGKTWKALLKDVDPATYVSAKNKGIYRDATAPKGGFCYRITVTDGKGNTAVSQPNNMAGADQKYAQTYKAPVLDYETGIDLVTPLFQRDEARLTSFGVSQNRPYNDNVNLINNPSFEGEDGQWNNRSFLNQNVQVVDDVTAPDGDKSLYFDTTGTTTGQWYKFTVNVEPNTDYVLSTWIKGDYLGADNAGKASFGVYDNALGGFMVYWDFYRSSARGSRLDQQIYPTAWDDEWHLRSVTFNSGSDTTVTIALYGYGSKMWLDDIALYKNGNGIKYTSAKANSYLSYKYYVECATCDPAKSVIENVRMDDASSDFWQTGEGWRNGFLSFEDSGDEFGTSLKYTTSDNPVGNYYIKWLSVEPHTEYVFSANIKILESGDGKFVLLEDKLTQPSTFMEIEFDNELFGNDWFSYAIGINTKEFDSLGIAICDLGGSALFDNVRLFKVEDGEEVDDVHAYDGVCDDTCNLCGETRVAQHEYINNCDRDCNLCGAIRMAPHVYDGVCDETCNACEVQRKAEPHAYVITQIIVATCNTDGAFTHTCTSCGDTYNEPVPATGAHQYDNGCDATCNACGFVREINSHNFADACDRDCNNCGFIRVPPHDYEDSYDDECGTCGALREVPERPTVIRGDANGDGRVNNRDLGLLQQYLADWDVELIFAATDLNDDGRINNRDLGLLQQYLAQ